MPFRLESCSIPGNPGADILTSAFAWAQHEDNGDPLTFAWSFVTTPAGSQVVLSAPVAALTSFVPDVAGMYLASLVVNDGLINSDPNNVTIEVSTRQDRIAEILMEVIRRVNAMPGASLKNDNLKGVLTQQVGIGLGMLEKATYGAQRSARPTCGKVHPAPMHSMRWRNHSRVNRKKAEFSAAVMVTVFRPSLRLTGFVAGVQLGGDVSSVACSRRAGGHCGQLRVKRPPLC